MPLCVESELCHVGTLVHLCCCHHVGRKGYFASQIQWYFCPFLWRKGGVGLILQCEHGVDEKSEGAWPGLSFKGLPLGTYFWHPSLTP